MQTNDFRPGSNANERATSKEERHDAAFYEADTLSQGEPSIDLERSGDSMGPDHHQPNESLASLLESLTREALATVQLYEDAIRSTTDTGLLAELRRVHAEQSETLARIVAATIEKGGMPQPTSGTLGTVAAIAGRAAAALGDVMMLRALEAAEDLRRKRLERATEREDIDHDVLVMLRHRVIPRQERHIAALSRLQEQVRAG